MTNKWTRTFRHMILRFGVALLIGAAYPATARAQTLPVEAQAELEAGLAAAQVGDWDAAIKAFEQARQLAPTAPELLFNLGLAFERKGKRPLIAAAWYRAYLAAALSAGNWQAVCERIPGLVETHRSTARYWIEQAAEAESEVYKLDAERNPLGVSSTGELIFRTGERDIFDEYGFFQPLIRDAARIGEFRLANELRTRFPVPPPSEDLDEEDYHNMRYVQMAIGALEGAYLGEAVRFYNRQSKTKRISKSDLWNPLDKNPFTVVVGRPPPDAWLAEIAGIEADPNWNVAAQSWASSYWSSKQLYPLTAGPRRWSREAEIELWSAFASFEVGQTWAATLIPDGRTNFVIEPEASLAELQQSTSENPLLADNGMARIAADAAGWFAYYRTLDLLMSVRRAKASAPKSCDTF